MKPIKISFQAFASYAEKAELDLEKLDSLFLINGETGAGKTAILDAMMYALYGESSGGERSEVRCVLPEAADIPTKVEFIFESGGERYKFTREIRITPRKKKLEPLQDCFYFDREKGEYVPFFENPKQSFVRDKAVELTGLSAEQFRQVVILPQGRFERLLTSGSDEKEKILSTLFCAEKYTALSEAVYAKAASERDRLNGERSVLEAMLTAENAESAEKLGEEIKKLSETEKELSPQLEKVKKELSEAHKRLTDAEMLSESFRELSGARKRLSGLEKKEAAAAEIGKILEMHEKAVKARPEYAAFREARQALEIRETALSEADRNCSAAKKENALIKGRKDEISALEKEIAEKTERLTLLNGLSETYEKIGAAEKELNVLSAEYAECEASRRDTEASLRDTVKEISVTAERRSRIIAEFSEKLPGLRSKKAVLENGEKNSKDLERYQSALNGISEDIARLSEQAKKAESRKQAAEKNYDRLYEEYIVNTAAELSSGLKEGMPCPVCGSLSHPMPAKKEGGSVTFGQVKAAKAAFEEISEQLLEIREKISAQQARIPAAQQYISECKQAAEESGYTPQLLETVRKQCAEAERQNDLLPELGKRAAELDKQREYLENALKTASGKAEELRFRKAGTQKEISLLKERLPDGCPDKKTYDAAVYALRKELREYSGQKEKYDIALAGSERRLTACETALAQAEKEHLSAQEHLKESEKAFEDKLSRCGIDTAGKYESLLLTDEKAAAYAAERDKYFLERHAAEETVRTLSGKLEGKTPPDTEKIRSEAERAERLYGEISGQAVLCTERLARLKKLEAEYSQRRKKYETDLAKSDKQLAFAKFMRGDKGISFTRYVLGIMLRLVTEEANRILSDIHGGMFRLCVKTELAANSKQGLDLEVENTAASLSGEQGVRYGVRDLSGGEKFLISLALSLGLSSVAQSRTGGTAIEAMFVDEGFGSLDTGSLREAVGILCRLSGGRSTVGIISHVEELRSVIPCVVKVERSAGKGSRIVM